jgi:hypothetical protein
MSLNRISHHAYWQLPHVLLYTRIAGPTERRLLFPCSRAATTLSPSLIDFCPLTALNADQFKQISLVL